MFLMIGLMGYNILDFDIIKFMLGYVALKAFLIALIVSLVSTQMLPSQISMPPNSKPVPTTTLTQQYKPPAIKEIYNDDEFLPASVKNMNDSSKSGNIELTLRPLRSTITLGSQSETMPAMVSLKSSGGTRSNVDLVCVLDVSGSMTGQKIELLKQTMKYLVELLTPNDRLSIIKFESDGTRVTPLSRVNGENVPIFLKEIQVLQADGGTNIMSGTELALKTLRDRKYRNEVSSIFLLSDGQDNEPGAVDRLKAALAHPVNSDLGAFSIHTFGFGAGHDEKLMSQFALLKDGSFYFIKDYSTLDLTFSNALGAIISVVGNNIVVDVKQSGIDIAQGIIIKKVYGNSWVKIKPGHYRIRLTQLMTEVSKDYVFELQIPRIRATLKEDTKKLAVVSGVLTANGLKGEVMSQAATLSLIFVRGFDPEVYQNYLRIKAALLIEDGIRLAEQNKFEQARRNIDGIIADIITNQDIRQQKLKTLVQDLKDVRSKLTKPAYEAQGKKDILSAQNAHATQNNFQYASPSQMRMNEATTARSIAMKPTVSPVSP